MNKTIKTVLLMVVLGLPHFANAQSNILRLHGKAQVYYWDFLSNSPGRWVWQNEEITKYDGKGRIILDVRINDTTTNDTIFRIFTSYDANGSTFSKSYYYINDTAYPGRIDTLLNDNRGNLIRHISYNTNGYKLVLQNGAVYSLTYDANNHVVSSKEMDYTFNISNNSYSWEQGLENYYILNSDGSWKSWTQVPPHDGNHWQYYAFVDSIEWHWWDGYNSALNGLSTYNNLQLTSAHFYEWRDTNWKDMGKLSATFGANGGSVTMTTLGGINVLRDTVIMDSLRNCTEAIQYGLYSTFWRLGSGSRQKFTYDSNGNIIQEIYQIADAFTNYHFEDTLKYVYSDFSSYQSIKPTPPSLPITLYPNPATETLHLQANINTNENMDITIYTMQGQAVLHEQINSNELSPGINIPVNNLVNGMYILRAVSGSGESRVKFVKE